MADVREFKNTFNWHCENGQFYTLYYMQTSMLSSPILFN